MGSQVLPGTVEVTAWDSFPLGDLTLSLKQPHTSPGTIPGRQTGLGASRALVGDVLPVPLCFVFLFIPVWVP